MEAFHFLRPWWLLGVPILLLASPWLWSLCKQRSGWHQVLAPHLGNALLGQSRTRSQAGWFAMFSGGCLITCVALAGPTWERLPTASVTTERSVIIIMDMSLNTRASDVLPDRLTRLRFKGLDLLNQLEGHQVGLIAYAGDAFVISPLTHDFANMRGMLPALSPEIMPSPGNYPLRAFTEADRMVSDTGFAHAEIYWLSAGMQLDDYQEIRRFLQGKNYRLSTLLAGDEERSPIRLASGDIMRDNLGRLSMAELNAGLFARLSAEFDGRHARLQADNQDIEFITEQRPWREQVSETDNLTSDQWRDRGPYLAWLLLPIALLALRRGVLLSVGYVGFVGLVTGTLLFASTPPVYAASAPLGFGERTLLNSQQQAQRQYERGDYAGAAATFTDPMMRGNALYRSGNYAAALDAYAQANESPERWYNSGNALAQIGEFSAASDAYAQALALRPDWPAALDNKALVDQLNQPQPPQSDEQDADQDQTPQDSDPNTEEDAGADADADSDANRNATEPTGDDSQDSAEPAEAGSDNESADTRSEPNQSQTPDDSQTGDEPADVPNTDVPNTDAPTAEEHDNELNAENLQAAFNEADLSDEEREELEQLMRRVQNDPATLLRNRMRLEAERRQQTQPPRGVRRP